MDASAAATVASAVIAVFALGFGFFQYRERRRQQLLIDLQGDKETVAAVATRVRNGKLPWRWRYRRELLEAMCLATVFETSGRSRSLLYAALVKAMAKRRSRKMITSSVEDISAVIARNSPYTDLARARRRLFALRAALSVNDDIRIRVEHIDAYLSQPDARKKFDKRCSDNIHEWGVLKSILEQRGSVVLVCPNPRVDGATLGCPAIALDFHMTARLPKETTRRPAQEQPTTQAPDSTIARCQQDQNPSSRHERFQLTELGQRLRLAKYCGSAADRDLIADELASLIANHPTYATTRVIAVVPASKHHFSDQLGEQVTRRVSELLNISTKCVQLARKAADTQVTRMDVENAAPGFTLTDPDAVKGRDVILLDDVYRAGDTLRAAAQALRDAGAKQVIGLTATCTVSAIAPHCGNH